MKSHRLSGYALVSDGILTLIAGLVVFFLTGISQAVLVYLFSAYAVVYGVSQVVAARNEVEERQNPIAFYGIGIFGIVAGLLFLMFTSAELSFVVTYIAVYAMIMGAGQASTAYAFKEIHGYEWLAAQGVLQAAFGLLLLAFTGISLANLVTVIAAYAIVTGALTTAYGYMLTISMHSPTAAQMR